MDIIDFVIAVIVPGAFLLALIQRMADADKATARFSHSKKTTKPTKRS